MSDVKQVILAALVGVLVSGPTLAKDVAICTGTLNWPSGATADYEFHLVFSCWTGRLVVKGWTESFLILNDKSTDVRAITGQVAASPKDDAFRKRNEVQELKSSRRVV